jgi:putative membrane protein
MKALTGIVAAAAVALSLSFAVADQGQQGQGGMRKSGQYSLTADQQQQLQQFVDKVHQMNLSEIRTGTIAEQKATDPKVKELASMMVREHREADRRLQEFASKHNIAFTEQTGKFDRLGDLAAEQMKANLMEKMQGMSGKEFDKFYVTTQLGSHQYAVSFLETCSAYLTDNDARSLANDLLKTVQGHTQHIEQLFRQMSTGSSSVQ